MGCNRYFLWYKTPMETKLSKLLAMMNANQWDEALKFAGKFPMLGEEKRAITRAREALIRPEFFLQLGRDVDAIIAEGRQALVRRYRKA